MEFQPGRFKWMLRSRLAREVEEIESFMRRTLLDWENEHPNWGPTPGAEAAEIAARNHLFTQKYYNPNANPYLLSAAQLAKIRAKSRPKAGLPKGWEPEDEGYDGLFSQGYIRSRRRLAPSAAERAKEDEKAAAYWAANMRPSPEDVPLPGEADEGYDDDLLLQDADLAVLALGAHSSQAPSTCTVLVNKRHAYLMRRFARCGVTMRGLEHLDRARRFRKIQVARLDAEKEAESAEQWNKSCQRLRRARFPERYTDRPTGLAGGRPSGLSAYTAAEDADDPFGQRDARAERLPLSDFTYSGGARDDKDVQW